ncbi:MAG: hypothetical protein R3C56_16225 [Pirellulaceae bacterium]
MTIRDAPAKIAYEPRAGEGAWATEAPRGMIYCRYRTTSEGLIEFAKIVPQPLQNQRQIEVDLRAYLPSVLDLPDAELGMACERLIRSYDPCISLHALPQAGNRPTMKSAIKQTTAPTKPSPSSQPLVIGIGSPHGDDRAGWEVVERFRAMDLKLHRTACIGCGATRRVGLVRSNDHTCSRRDCYPFRPIAPFRAGS